MTKAAIYARCSSGNQRAASIEDQFRICRESALRQGWQVVESYSDQAFSGANLRRPGIQKLLTDAQSNRFNVILAESLDRISRDQEDIAGVYKRMTFAGVKVVTLSEGAVSELHIGLKGTMAALYLKDLADKTRRGLRGRVEEGKSGGGNSYGYEVVNKLDGNGQLLRGERRVNEAEAHIVRRVFQDYAAGKSPRRIAHELNAEGVPGPAGNAWGPSTIYGNWRRGTGILNNELYMRRLVWNRLRYVRDPDTGRRVSRLNPESEWIVQEVPELRIVEDELWSRVKDKQKAVRAARNPLQDGNALGARKRPPYLFSGLIKCGACGGGCSMISATHYGCSTARNKGTCDNRSAIKRDELEDRVLRAMRGHLMEPALFDEFCRAYTGAVNEWRIAQRAELAGKEAEAKKVERQIRKIIDAIKDGFCHASMKDEMTGLENRKIALERALKIADKPPMLLHPNLAKVYSRKIGALYQALQSDEGRTTAADLLRTLIDRIVLEPGYSKRGILIKGDIAGILGLASAEKVLPAMTVRGGQVPMVAGV